MAKIEDLVDAIAKAQAIALSLSKNSAQEYAYPSAHLRYAMSALHAVIQNKLEARSQEKNK